MEPGDDNLVAERNSRLLKFYSLVNSIKCFLYVKVLNFLRIANNTLQMPVQQWLLCLFIATFFRSSTRCIMVRHREVPPSLCHSVQSSVTCSFIILYIYDCSDNGLSWSDLSPYHLWHRSCGACADTNISRFFPLEIIHSHRWSCRTASRSSSYRPRIWCRCDAKSYGYIA